MCIPPRAIVIGCVFLGCSSSSKPAPLGSTTTSSDAGAVDASPSDGGGTLSHGAATWCAERTENLCDDFDTPAFTAKSWLVNSTTGTNGPGLPPSALDTVNHTSAPNAFVARTPATTVVTPELFQLQAFGPGPDALHVDADFAFDVRVGAIGSGPRIELARVEGVNPITFRSYAVAVLVSASNASIELTQGSNASAAVVLAAAPRANQWSRVRIHLGMERTVNGPPTTGTIQIDDAAPETFSLERGMGIRPFLKLGLAVTGPSTACEVAYDNVTYDAR